MLYLMNAAVFLDRDNTLIHNDGDLGDPDQVRLIQGAATAVASLCGLGYKVVVITNQGGVARGKYTEEDVQAVNQRVAELIAAGANGAKIDRFYYCPYHPEGTVPRYRKEHPTRKPAPGMLLEAARDMNLDLSQSWTIGDQVRDIQAGLAAGTRTILLRPDADRLKPLDPSQYPGLTEVPGTGERSTPDFYARNLVEAVRIVAQQRKPETSEQLHRSGPTQRKWDAAAVAKLQRERQAVKEETDANTATQAKPTPTNKPVRIPPKSQKATKPFRPWNAPEAEVELPLVTHPVLAEVEPDKTATETDEPETTVPHRAAEAGAPVVREAPTDRSIESTEKTLRLILQELRTQRGVGEEFSYMRILAIVLQTIAGACLLGAFWLGGGDSVVFMRLIGSAIFVQLAVISALLWDRRG